MSEKKVKVGVTLRVNGAKGQQSIWENGIFQNCIFLAQLYANAPHVSESYLVIGGNANKEARQHFMAQTKAKWLDEKEAVKRLDVIIEMAVNLEDQNLAYFLQRGGKLISAKVGNDYVIDAERVIFGLPAASLVRNVPYSAIWTSEAYASPGVQYFETLHRAPCKILPHLWSPSIMTNALRNTKGADGQPISFGYRPGSKRWNVAIFEPNICMVKTSVVPLVACDYVNSLDPNVIERVLALNTQQFTYVSPENEANNNGARVFIDLVQNLDLQQQDMVLYEKRLATFEIMARYAQACFSHQLENAQNYVYYELLHGGYPLIHNSPILKDVGYYYPDFDSEEGGLALLRAFYQHDKNLDEYSVKAMQFVNSLDPLNPRNIQLYDEALVEVIQ